MTVAELITKLSTMNQSAVVVADINVINDNDKIEDNYDGFVTDVRDISAETDGETVMIFAESPRD